MDEVVQRVKLMKAVKRLLRSNERFGVHGMTGGVVKDYCKSPVASVQMLSASG